MSDVIEAPARPEDRFVSFHEMNDGHTLNGANAAVQGVRQEAIRRFAALGFPGRKDEAWKYTNIGRLVNRPYQVRLAAEPASLSEADLDAFAVPGLDAYRAVLVDGRFAPALSRLDGLPEGVAVTGFAEATERHAAVVDRHFARYADYREEPFAALNTAFVRDGLFVYVPKGVVLERPLHVVHVMTTPEDAFVQPRHLLVFEEHSQAKLVETAHSLTDASVFTNAVAEVYVGPRAHVTFYKVQDEGPKAVKVDRVQVYQEAESVCTVGTFTFSGEVVRNDLSVRPDAEHCETHLYGLALPRGTEHVDNHTLIDHAKPNCQSNELYKSVLDDEASGVFNGKVFVRQDAQKTNAFQENKAVLLTPTATMNAKPELEIYADDVKCSHGATTGQLDREALFYLRSRGLSEARARRLLLLAFAGDVTATVDVPALREHLEARLSDRFSN